MNTWGCRVGICSPVRAIFIIIILVLRVFSHKCLFGPWLHTDFKHSCPSGKLVFTYFTLNQKLTKHLNLYHLSLCEPPYLSIYRCVPRKPVFLMFIFTTWLPLHGFSFQLLIIDTMICQYSFSQVILQNMHIVKSTVCVSFRIMDIGKHLAANPPWTVKLSRFHKLSKIDLGQRLAWRYPKSRQSIAGIVFNIS